MGKIYVTAVGRVVNPLLKTVGETPLLTFSIPVDDKKSEETIWYRVNVWGKQGEALGGFIKQGHAVTVIGELQPHGYTDKEGAYKLSLDIRATDVQVQSSKSESAEEGEGTALPATPGNKAKAAVAASDDDIPF